MSNDLKSLQKEIADLKEKLQQLESMLSLYKFGTPVQIAFTGCAVCGMDTSRPMNYVCYNNKCPGKITCNTTQF